MNINELNDFKHVVAFFWGEHNTTLVPLNELSVTYVIGVLNTAGDCGNIMDLTPRPYTPLSRPAYSYAIKQISRIAKNITMGNKGVYINCKNTVVLVYRTKIIEIMNWIY